MVMFTGYADLMTQPTEHTARYTRRIAIEPSPHASRGWVTCIEKGAICWRGPIEALAAAAPFDAVCCHDEDAEIVGKTVDALALKGER